MASRSVLNLTYLQQHNNPKKGLGPVGNALCSALNPLFLAVHFTRHGEKVRHTWERLPQLLQGASTNGALLPMPEAIFAADRGYNSEDTIQFVGGTLGASLIGTHRRDLWYPYVFGDGLITARNRGVLVSEKGCRAVYNARLRPTAGDNCGVRPIEACIYRESCSGRIAALVHNNSSLFPSRCFTVVLKEAFRTQSAIRELRVAAVVFDTKDGSGITGTRSWLSHNGENAVDQVLHRVRALTYLQSEDPVWFLLRAFRFTSRTGHGFVAAIARDYTKRVRGMAAHLLGKCISPGSNNLPDTVTEVERCIGKRWDTVLSVLGMRKQTIERPSSRRALAERIRGFSQSRINSFTKSDLQEMLRSFGRPIELRGPKAQLVTAMLQLKHEITEENVNLEEPDEGTQSEETLASEARADVHHCLLEASVSAWVMKPLVSTMGMREGSRNEIEVIKALPSFFKKQTGAYEKAGGISGYTFRHGRGLNMLHVRSTGLLESKMCTLLADSPDAIAAATMEGVAATSAEENRAEVFAVEVKTMTALRTIQAAKRKSEQYGKFIFLHDVGVDHESTQLFHSLVPTASYRAQTLHHAACMSINNVLYVVATGGFMTEGGIIYACMVQFAESIRHQYTYLLDCVRHTSFWWIGGESMCIPKDYDDILRQSHASDIHSFMSYYGLSQSLRACVEQRGSPLPPSRMIRLTPTVYWNHLKGGVDVISRYMKTLARCNISESPVVSIIARILSMQVSNAAVVYRLYCARKTKILPTVKEYESSSKKGYQALRHNISQCETFRRFTRALAREWVEDESDQVQGAAQNYSRRTEHMSPMFSRNAAERYNVGIHKARRLNRALLHEQITSKATYCVLCSWDLRGMKEGKLKVKRK